MLADQFHEAVAAARSGATLENVTRLLWRAHAEGHVDDGEAQAIAEAAQGRRAAWATSARATTAMPASARRRPAPCSPDRARSLDRRRRQVMSGAMPPQIGALVTAGEAAALSVIAREVKRSGCCALPIDAVAALAGVCRSVVKNALRAGRRLGLIEVKERRRRGQRNLTNIVIIVARDWLAWLKVGELKGGGGTTAPSTVSKDRNRGKTPSEFLRRGQKRLGDNVGFLATE